MATGLFSSAIFGELMLDEEIAARLDDAAQVESWLAVESALARAQGSLGLVPASSAEAIAQACEAGKFDTRRLASGTACDGVPIPALLTMLRETLDEEHAQWLHFGATSQDILDTGLVLRLRAICDIVDARLRLLLQVLADLADEYAELPMVGRTRRMPATPTSFGAVIAVWGAPLLAQVEGLAQLRPRLLRVSLAGASGNSTALGPRAGEVRAALARELDLAAGDICWHTDRSALSELACLLSRITTPLAKMAEDCLFAAVPEVGELELPNEGASSTMPHKRNPIMAETLIALNELAADGEATLRGAAVHRQQRDGVAWLLEWYALPQTCLAAGRALQIAIALLTRLEPIPERMRANIDAGHGLVFAESIRFRLLREMSREQAQAEVKRLCAEAVAQQTSLAECVRAAWPDIDWNDCLDPVAQLGDGPQQARRFAELVRGT